MGFFVRPTLKVSDDKRTNAALITLRQSIYPLCLVTILFFLWVRTLPSMSLTTLQKLTTPGLLLRPHRHSKQALPRNPRHHAQSLFRPASRILRRLPARLPRPRKLDPAPLWLPNGFHLGSLPLRRRVFNRVAVSSASIVWWILRRDLHHWEWPRELGNGGKSVFDGLWAAEV
jgi:hypothetical protein